MPLAPPVPGVLVGCAGKLPNTGDFIRLAPSASPADAIEAAFLALHLDQVRDLARVAAFDASAPAIAFLPGAQRWWGVVALPSRDAVDRRNPFIVCAGIPALGGDEECGVQPFAFAPFIPQVLALAQRGFPPPGDALRAACAAAAADIDCQRGAATAMDALDALPQEALWQGLADDHASRCLALSQLRLLAAAPARSGGLRLRPLTSPVQAAFFAMLLALLRKRGTGVGLVFGSSNGQTQLTLLWGEPTAETLACALWPDCAPASFSASLADLVPMTGAATAVRGLSSGLRGLSGGIAEPDAMRDALDRDILREPGISARDLLHRLISVGRTERYPRH